MEQHTLANLPDSVMRRTIRYKMIDGIGKGIEALVDNFNF